MPGYNHYPNCVCGWCCKNGSYSPKYSMDNFDTSYAKRYLKEHGADRSRTACFVVPNASCPVCFAKVYYYQNQYGGRVFFDELGWPWPKHPCTDNRKTRGTSAMGNVVPIMARKRGVVEELLENMNIAAIDLNAAFETKYGHAPSVLLRVDEVHQIGFESFIQAKVISILDDKTLHLSLIFSKMTPKLGEYFSFIGTEASFLDSETLSPMSFEAKVITADAYALAVTLKNF